ncbi:hypothetical protein ACRS6B_01575 [Nocardia asteroides]
MSKPLASLEADRDGHLWFLALCGLWRSELGGMRWSGADLERKTLVVRIERR